MSLIRNESALDYEYLPEKLPHRETEIETIIQTIKPLSEGRRAANLFIHGPPGVGKTATVKFVFKKVEEETNLRTCFINCWRSKTTHSILLEIGKSVGLPMPRTGVSTDDVMRRIKFKLRNLVIALDESDKLVNQDLLYNIIEEYGKKVSIILITNHKESLLKLEPRIRSRLALEELEFKPYTYEQIRDILEERRKIALVPGVIDEDAFKLIVKKTYEYKDIRAGLFLMYKAASIAEERIELKHVKEAAEKLVDFNAFRMKELSKDERIILDIVTNKPGITSGELFAMYKEKGGEMKQRAVRNYVNKLISSGFIRFENISGKGKTRKLYRV